MDGGYDYHTSITNCSIIMNGPYDYNHAVITHESIRLTSYDPATGKESEVSLNAESGSSFTNQISVKTEPTKDTHVVRKGDLNTALANVVKQTDLDASLTNVYDAIANVKSSNISFDSNTRVLTIDLR
jgi:hypothetical protein